jgi:hypothetical protein
VLYATGFEPAGGFDIRYTLVGQGGWTGTEFNGNGLVTNYFSGQGQQAYVGLFPIEATNGVLSTWVPIGFNPVAAGKPRVRFSVWMALVDSTTAVHDSFRWSVYDNSPSAERLFALDFDLADQSISAVLSDGTFKPTGLSFSPGGLYELIVDMDFARNRWSATLEGTEILPEQPISTGTSTPTLGDIDAVWLYRAPGPHGDNYMVFDNYTVTAAAAPAAACALESARWLNGVFLCRLQGEPGRNYAMETSTNLLAWSVVRTNTASVDGSADFVDPSAAPGARFYRARSVP